MTGELFAFYFFAVIAVGAALAVVTLRHPVQAVMALVLTFFSCACIFLLAEAEFLAIALVLVYVGAVMVLFLFVVMMLDVDVVALREGFARFVPLGIVVAVVMALEMVALIGLRRLDEPLKAAATPASSEPNLTLLGRALFTDYLYPFEIAAVLLTVAIIAAIALTLRRRPAQRRQDPARQVKVQRDERVRLVRMAAEKEPDA